MWGIRVRRCRHATAVPFHDQQAQISVGNRNYGALELPNTQALRLFAFKAAEL